MTKSQRIGLITTLGALSAIGPFSIDMYLPGFPAIAADLKVSVAVVGYSLTSYFIGISLGQLVYGPVSDRFGRRRPLLVGLAVYIVASVACGFSPTIDVLVALRFMMALGACVGMVLGRAIARDRFPVNEVPGVFSSFMLIIAVSPILAPSVGGYLAVTLGWRFVFFLLAAIAALLALVVVVSLPESKEPDPLFHLTPRHIAARYVSVVRNDQFFVFACVAALSSASTFAYISGAPFVFMQLFGLSQTQFGMAFALNGAGLIMGSQLNRVFLRRFSSAAITRAAVGSQAVIGALLAGGALFHLLTLPALFVLLCSFLFCAGLVGPNAAALALEPFATSAGTASALLGSFQMAIGSVATAIVSSLANGTALPMTAAMWASIIVSGMLLLANGLRRSLRRTPAASKG